MTVQTSSTRQSLLARSRDRLSQIGLALGLSLALGKEATAQQSLTSAADGMSEFLQALLTTIQWGAFVVGMCALVYGFKLLWDKSNDRADVKASAIMFAIGGGAGLMLLWMIVGMIAGSLGGDASAIGVGRSGVNF